MDYLPAFLRPTAKAPEVAVLPPPVPAPVPLPLPQAAPVPLSLPQAAPTVAGRRRTRKHRKNKRLSNKR